jgi:hypothetical protein
MVLTDSIILLRNTIDRLSINEALNKGHAPHPEDYVYLAGSSGATEAIQSAIQTIKNPKTITIKWDGYPALIFGRGTDGQFSIMDKHMFNKKDGTGRAVYSPEQFAQYDAARGVNRSDLAVLINQIWAGLEESSANAIGYYWGDLLFSKPLTEQNGVYVFKANPNGITYTVQSDSSVGKLIKNKTAGIAVHQYIPPGAITTDDASSLDGKLGQLKNISDVAILPSAMPQAPNLKIDSTLLANAQSEIKNHGAELDSLLANAPGASFKEGLVGVYFNKKIREGNLNNLLNGFYDYSFRAKAAKIAKEQTAILQKKDPNAAAVIPEQPNDFIASRPMTAPMKSKVEQHLNTHKAGLIALFKIWVSIYKLKMDIWKKLDDSAKSSPVQGQLDDGTAGQEGFVANGFKYVNRMGFSRQNFAAR